MFRSRVRRLSSNTVSALIGAAAFAVFTTGTAVAVATTAVSITDAGSGVKAHVTNNQALATADRDPYNNVYARTDSGGKRLIGDGSGPLTVDGSVGTLEDVPTAWNRYVTDAWDQDVNAKQVGVTLPTSGDLRVRAVSVRVVLPVGQHLNANVFYVERDGTTVRAFLTLTPQGDDGAGRDVIVGTFSDDLYPKPGTTLYVNFVRAPSAGAANVAVTVLGQLS
jgi:proline racemase